MLFIQKGTKIQELDPFELKFLKIRIYDVYNTFVSFSKKYARFEV